MRKSLKNLVRSAAVIGLLLTDFSFVPQVFAVNANSTPVPEVKPASPNGKSVLFDNTHGETS